MASVPAADQFRALNGSLFLSNTDPDTVTVNSSTAQSITAIEDGCYLLTASEEAYFLPAGTAVTTSIRLPKNMFLPIRIESGQYSSISFIAASTNSVIQLVRIQ